jgi:hypothetical protein
LVLFFKKERAYFLSRSRAPNARDANSSGGFTPASVYALRSASTFGLNTVLRFAFAHS